MQDEAKRQVIEKLTNAKRELLDAMRIANGEKEVSKHLVRALRRMAGDCEYEQTRVAG